MSMIIFCTAFIVQFVGHQIGDYLFQTNTQAIKKATDLFARANHCLSYSIVIALLMCLFFGPATALYVFGATFIEHMIVDSRKPVVFWKNFIDRTVAGNKDFKIEELPFFVLINIDQAIHIVRIFIISYILAWAI